MRFSQFFAASVFLLSLIFSRSVNAELVGFEFESFTNGSLSFKAKVNKKGGTLSAGEFSLSVIDVPSYSGDWDKVVGHDSHVDVFCLQPHVILPQHRTVEYTFGEASNHFDTAMQIEKIGQLYTGFYDKIAQATSSYSRAIYSGAFQVALWELVYDFETPSLFSGNFQERGRGNSVVGSVASNWLHQLPSIENTKQLFVLQSDIAQDVIFARDMYIDVGGGDSNIEDVSLVSSIGVLGLSAGLILANRRRRTTLK